MTPANIIPLFIYFVSLVREKVVQASKKNISTSKHQKIWFWPANSVPSTRSLHEIHNRNKHQCTFRKVKSTIIYHLLVLPVFVRYFMISPLRCLLLWVYHLNNCRVFAQNGMLRHSLRGGGSNFYFLAALYFSRLEFNALFDCQSCFLLPPSRLRREATRAIH